MTHPFDAAVAAFSPTLPLGVAFSGGADSSALLLACARRWPGQVHAVHVHHGLQAAGDDFAAHCAAVCARWQVPLVQRRVDARHAPGDSPEDAARQARYRVFDEVLQQEWQALGIRTVALAQHADDQVETLLLALSRGAGLPGLAAMPARWQRSGVTFERPLLGLPGQVLRDWLQAQGEIWIEDPSNQDLRYTRNRIRHQLLPALQAVFPQHRDTLARSARHAAQAQGLLLELAEEDLKRVGHPPAIALLQGLSAARQANVLRHWLRQAHGCMPSEVQLKELLRQVQACTTRGHRIELKVGRGQVLREGGVLGWYN
ncbi:tRNA lysidine(34) synthetase TilS [Curvibacter sp. HBC61]|uniref:tRNA(Ile)-lysidine synthase n=1 Tax=Curvibacter cyanobacteriorum TaxID=3026422 RepID=A0ABT5MSR5_9BURK|nr:tRNA lysidine(34) synthetase TilS [Curvibacter sp. HBC61]MDD0837089.1 tRNA lysidine(34) synthetase TilS [Curvibacter sp. HBC61]